MAEPRAQPELAAIERAALRYGTAPRFDRHYVLGKLRRDPLYRVLPEIAGGSFGEVMDIGCGRGQLGILLLEQGRATSVRGLDWNEPHLDHARLAAGNLAFVAERRDLTRLVALPAADTVFLVDVLYQLETGVQQALLAAAARAARAQLVIRTPRSDLGPRRLAMLAMEWLGRPIWPNSGARVNPQPAEAMAAYLCRSGFHVSVTANSQGTPFANVMLVCTRNRCAGRQGELTGAG